MEHRRTQRTLLAVFGHPDDEAFGTGGLFALRSSLGDRVVLVTATRGEAGEISDPALADRENLGQVREAELRAATDALGVSELVMLGYRDSGMAGTEDNSHPDAFAMAPEDEVLGRLVGIMRRIRPDVVITFDEIGGYGHPDHIAANRFTTAAFRASGDASEYPGEGEPWEPGRLYYSVFPKQVFRRLRSIMEAHGTETADLDRFEESGIGWPDDGIHAEIDVSGVVEAKWAALNCHRTQFGPDHIFNRIPEPDAKALMSSEWFVQIEPDPPPGVSYSDLFDGL
jgi:LmbE family N-acetylglucosaminyl deacetylase